MGGMGDGNGQLQLPHEASRSNVFNSMVGNAGGGGMDDIGMNMGMGVMDDIGMSMSMGMDDLGLSMGMGVMSIGDSLLTPTPTALTSSADPLSSPPSLSLPLSTPRSKFSDMFGQDFNGYWNQVEMVRSLTLYTPYHPLPSPSPSPSHPSTLSFPLTLTLTPTGRPRATVGPPPVPVLSIGRQVPPPPCNRQWQPSVCDCQWRLSVHPPAPRPPDRPRPVGRESVVHAAPATRYD